MKGDYIPHSQICWQEIFMSYVEVSDECWRWLGGRQRNWGIQRYGKFRVGDRTISAHRLSHLIFNGDIPPEKFVLHKCDNVICVNPEHLFLGTAKDNVLDARQKGRMCIGEANGNARLTWRKVEELRSLYKIGGLTYVAVAKIFGITPTHAQAIIEGKNWRAKR